MAIIKYISAEELKKLYGNSDIIICDIREADEFQREHIIDAKNTPLSQFNVEQMNELAKNSTLVFHCQSGTRTRNSEAKFQAINCNEVLVLKDGFSSWKKLGCAVEVNNKAPLPIMRQVQIAAGFLILLGVVLSLLVSPVFILLSGFVGAGLMFAGISGFCGMANLLMLLPYNKNNGCNDSCKR